MSSWLQEASGMRSFTDMQWLRRCFRGFGCVLQYEGMVQCVQFAEQLLIILGVYQLCPSVPTGVLSSRLCPHFYTLLASVAVVALHKKKSGTSLYSWINQDVTQLAHRHDCLVLPSCLQDKSNISQGCCHTPEQRCDRVTIRHHRSLQARLLLFIAF